MNAQVRSATKPLPGASYQDVLDAPPNMVAEVLAGTLHMHPRPASPNAWATSNTIMELGPAFGQGRGGPGGWWILFEPELRRGNDILVPDLGGWRRDSMPEYPDVRYFEVAPDWVCEVLSPSTVRIDRHEKAGIHAREGVSHLWFIDPVARTLEVMALRDGHWVLLATLADDAPVSQPPFYAITFPLDALWPNGLAGDGKAPEPDAGDQPAGQEESAETANTKK